jgi:hypothetical protein
MPSGIRSRPNANSSWLQGFARHQPVTPVIETLRGLRLGTPVGSQPWIALAWCGGNSGCLGGARRRPVPAPGG